MISVKAHMAGHRHLADQVVRPRAELPAYDAAGTGRRTSEWQPSAASINAIIFSSAETLRSRSRDMARRSPWIARGLRVSVANHVGTGIKLQSQHPDPEVRAKIHQEWEDWGDVADFHGRTDIYGLQAEAWRCADEAGESLARLEIDPSAEGVPLRIRLLEPDHLPLTLNQPLTDGGQIRQGIEYDAQGRRRAYHLYKSHPGDSGLISVSSDLIRVPAAEIVHLFEPLRIGQGRGVPAFAAGLLRAYEFDNYEDAQMVRQRDGAALAGFIKEGPAPGQTPLAGQPTQDADGTKVEITRLESGTWQKLRPGEDAVPAAAIEMGEGYGEFQSWALRGCGAARGVSYEHISGDLSGVNYSSIKTGELVTRRDVERIQHGVIVAQWCRPIWLAWLSLAVLAGALPVGAAQFRRERRTWQRVHWVPPSWGSIDRTKDVNADIAEIGAGLSSRSKKIQERGFDPEVVDAEIAADQERASRLGLQLGPVSYAPVPAEAPPAEGAAKRKGQAA